MKPQNFSLIEIYPGQTFDFLLETKATVPANYWIYAKGRFDGLKSILPGLAVLKYENGLNVTKQFPETEISQNQDRNDFGQHFGFKNYYPTPKFSKWKVQIPFSISF